MSVTAVPVKPVNSSTRLWLWLGVILALALAFGLAWMGTRAAVAAKGTNDQFLAWNKGQSGVKTTASGLQYQVIAPGEGPNIADGDVANVQIEGFKRDGSVFQEKTGGPFEVKDGAFIPGFLEALRLMRKGAKYRVWLPPKLAYDSVPSQPGMDNPLKGQVLIFDIEVKEVMTAAEVQMRQMQQQQMMQQQLEAQNATQGNEAAPEGEPKK
ncbi:FKBP-type peptidyl-prolyl cis-trans isomerase [Sphingomonas sp. LB-2]|uniref:FKBP-type peptidyl-prolyl cis-trans isomerase n=1 Tax=Sphingomonas caeni TaxID=2984949 RepID=UPI0022325261|nr:FKBP-type peptidyl-prolyl cis-trans isomerase [Sphingomonas caeni]MCW3845625.1 FKBP-type peptidyl-prolyl cis-trans isomerase [Sphingomonas caeni]